MDTKGKKRAKTRGGDKTPESGGKSKWTSKLGDITKAFGKGTPSPIKFFAKAEMEKRETDEICKAHSNPIVAFEEKTGKTLCEK